MAASFTRKRRWKTWVGDTADVERLIRVAMVQVGGDDETRLHIQAVADGIEDEFDRLDEFMDYLGLSDPREVRRIVATVSAESAPSVVVDFDAAKPAVQVAVRGPTKARVEDTITLLSAEIGPRGRFSFPVWWELLFILVGLTAAFAELITGDKTSDGKGAQGSTLAFAGAILLAAAVVALIPSLWKHYVAPPLEITTPAGEPRIDRVRVSAVKLLLWAVGGVALIILGALIQGHLL